MYSNAEKSIIRTIASFFGVGYLPLAPGTYASFAGIVLYLLVQKSLIFFWGMNIALFLIGMWVSKPAEQIFKQKDSPHIVIDEVSGMLLCFVFIPCTLLNVLLAFIFFRVFDITKPFPINKIQKLPGGWGVMLDDILAAVYTNLVLQSINVLFLTS